LQFNVGPGGGMEIPVEVDYRKAFQASDHAAWDDEYAANVEIQQWMPMFDESRLLEPAGGDRRLLRDQAEDLDFWWNYDEPGGFLPQTTERQANVEF